MMSRSTTLFAVGVTASLAGCCDESIVARAVIGHKSPDECARLLDSPEAPVSIVCPGTEVTVCWRGKGPAGAQLAVSPDPNGQSGSQPLSGAIHLTPSADTTVKITASDCASTTKQIEVITGPTPVDFDAHWNAQCSQINYRLDPLFVDDKVQAIDATAKWEPILVDEASGNQYTCTTPPFLEGYHPIESYGFDLSKPYLTEAFSRPLKAIEDWNYEMKACAGVGYKCNRFASLPFAMTLTCPK